MRGLPQAAQGAPPASARGAGLGVRAGSLLLGCVCAHLLRNPTLGFLDDEQVNWREITPGLVLRWGGVVFLYVLAILFIVSCVLAIIEAFS